MANTNPKEPKKPDPEEPPQSPEMKQWWTIFLVRGTANHVGTRICQLEYEAKFDTKKEADAYLKGLTTGYKYTIMVIYQAR